MLLLLHLLMHQMNLQIILIPRFLLQLTPLVKLTVVAEFSNPNLRRYVCIVEEQDILLTFAIASMAILLGTHYTQAARVFIILIMVLLLVIPLLTTPSPLMIIFLCYLNFTQAQYQHLLSLLQQASGTTNNNDSQPPTRANLIQQGPSNFSRPNGNMSFIFPNVTSQTSHVFSLNSLNNSSSWIVDSGATDHISCSLKNFQVFSKIEPISIHLPNGAIVTSHYSGTVHFAPDFIIYNVLHVPDFRFNLFSISKFLSSHNHKLTFAGFLCQIQEVSTMKMVGLAKLQQGLYHLVTQDNSSLTPYLSSFNHISLSTINNNNLWHFRLGHFSDKRLNVLHE